MNDVNRHTCDQRPFVVPEEHPCKECELDNKQKEAMGLFRRSARQKDLNTISTGFLVGIVFHTNEAHDVISNPDKVKWVLGHALDKLGVSEDIDYTIQVRRCYETIKVTP